MAIYDFKVLFRGVLVVGIINLLLLWLYFQNVKKFDTIFVERNCSSEKKIISFGSKWWYSRYPYLNEVEKMCPQCTFTENPNLFNRSDAVIFHARTVPSMPPTKYKNQVWVWLWLEAPAEYRNKIHSWPHRTGQNYKNLFNWTMTYRKDADIYMPYGKTFLIKDVLRPDYNQKWAFLPSEAKHFQFIYKEHLMEIPNVENLKNRKMVAWIVSNCRIEPSKRMQLARELQKFIPIDIFGNCSNLKCPKMEFEGLTGNSGLDCRFNISQQYKFYLAFENSICEDYVTEKLFDTLLTQMVPIVYGGANYSSIAPPRSFINVEDFSSVKALANYIIHLDKNPLEYLKYFEWRKDYWVQNNGFVTGFCELCTKLWNSEEKILPKSYENITSWWFGRSDYEKSKRMACTNPVESTSFQTEQCFKFIHP